MLLLYYITPGYNVILRQQLSLFNIIWYTFEVCACLWVCHQIQVFNSDTPVYASVLDWQSQNTRLWLLDLIPHWTRAAFSLTASFVDIMWVSPGCRATLLICCSLSSLSDLIPDQRCPCCLPFGLGQCVLRACHQHRRSDARRASKDNRAMLPLTLCFQDVGHSYAANLWISVWMMGTPQLYGL